jgi:hypothetical protein
MSDPVEAGRDAPYEWIELVNIGREPVDLAGWTISDAAASDTLPSLIIPPGGYVVVAGSSARLPEGVAVVPVPDGEIGNGLGNSGDLLRLRDPAGRLVDALSFGSRVDIFDPAPPAPEAGETLGVRDPAADPAPENWAITMEPTPGERNRFPQPPGSPPASAPPAAGDGPAPRQASTLFQVDEGGGGGSVLPWMVLGGLAGISVGMLGAALARAMRRLRERRRPAPPPRDDRDA